MKQEFSKKWNSSIQPRKQRKYMYNAPIHIRKKIMKCNLTEDLRKKYGVRNIAVRKGDTVKILRGDFKGKTEKVEKVDRKNYKLYLSNVYNDKKDGTKIKYPIYYSNVRITELELSDKKRMPAKKEKVSK